MYFSELRGCPGREWIEGDKGEHRPIMNLWEQSTGIRSKEAVGVELIVWIKMVPGAEKKWVNEYEESGK